MVRLRVRMPEDGPVPVAPGGEGASGAVFEVSRTLPEQRAFPASVGQRVALGARRIHVLPTPISSFTVVADDAGRAAALARSPLLATLAARMQTRVGVRLGRGETAPPGMPVVETGPGSAATVAWLLRHGAGQILCLPASSPVPDRVVIHAREAAARDVTFAVAASVLRHVPAEARFLSIHPANTPEQLRSEQLRELLDARAAALARHGLDLRTEARDGDAETELAGELLAHEGTMLVLGVGDLEELDDRRLAGLLEGPVQRPVLIVRPGAADLGGSR
jgi:hypothetical protein